MAIIVIALMLNIIFIIIYIVIFIFFEWYINFISIWFKMYIQPNSIPWFFIVIKNFNNIIIYINSFILVLFFFSVEINLPTFFSDLYSSIIFFSLFKPVVQYHKLFQISFVKTFHSGILSQTCNKFTISSIISFSGVVFDLLAFLILEYTNFVSELLLLLLYSSAVKVNWCQT